MWHKGHDDDEKGRKANKKEPRGIERNDAKATRMEDEYTQRNFR